MSLNKLTAIEYFPSPMPNLRKLTLFGNTALSLGDCTQLLKACQGLESLYVGGTGMSNLPFASTVQKREIHALVPGLITLEGQIVHQERFHAIIESPDDQ